MTQVIGTASIAELKEIQRRGYDPKSALDAIVAEAKRRYPKAQSVIVQRSATHSGFDIVSL